MDDAYIPSSVALSDSVAYKADLGYDSLAPLIYKMRRGDAMRLTISSSSSMMNPVSPTEQQTGQAMWRAVLAKYGNTNFTIEGRGGSGASIMHLLHGGLSPDMMAAEGAARIGTGFDACILNVNYDNDTALGTTAAAFYDRFAAVIRSVQRVGCVPIVIPPLKAGAYFSGAADYETAVYKAAADTGAVLFPIQDTNLLPDGSAVDPQWYQPDLIHPNAAGAARYAAAFAALWPLKPGGAPSGRVPRDTWDDPQISGREFAWVDSLGVRRRSVWAVRSGESDGRAESTPLLSAPTPWIRSPAFTSDLRNPGSGEVVADLSQQPGESNGYLGSASGDSVNDASYLAGGGINCNNIGMFTIPVAGKRDLQFGRDYITLRLVVSGLTSGSDQTLWSRRNLSGGNAHCRIWIENSSGDLVIELANGAQTRVASPGVVGTGKAHVITITASPTGAARCYIDGVTKATPVIGTSFGASYAALPWRVGATVTGGGGFAFWLRGAVHWCEIGGSWTDRGEEALWITDQLKPALASRSLTWA